MRHVWRATLIGLFVIVLLPEAGALAARAGDWSREYQESLRRTAELRKQRRRSQGNPPGAIFTYPMPPALIIRQTPEVHGDVDAVLRLLR
jgi:hypothetical protein